MTAEIPLASEHDAFELSDALQALAISVRHDRGCLGCTARVAGEGRRTVLYQEEWESERQLRRRVASDDFTSLLSLLERSSAPPKLQFDFVAETRGLDYVAEVRGVQRES